MPYLILYLNNALMCLKTLIKMDASDKDFSKRQIIPCHNYARKQIIQQNTDD